MSNLDRQTLPRVLIYDRQHLDYPPIVGAVLNKVIGPDMVGPTCSETDTGAVVQP